MTEGNASARLAPVEQTLAKQELTPEALVSFSVYSLDGKAVLIKNDIPYATIGEYLNQLPPNKLHVLKVRAGSDVISVQKVIVVK